MKRPILILALIGLYSAAQAQSTKFEVQIKKTGTTDGVDESSDDAEQQNNVMDKLFDDDLDMGWEGDDFNIVATGFRFTGVTIPKGAKIDSAYIIFFSHEEEKDTAMNTIFGEASDDAKTFSMEELFLTRPKTQASYKWEVTEFWPIWKKFRTPDITAVIQEIVDRQGWKSGNSLAIMISGKDQGASAKDNARDVMSFENEEDPEDGGDGKNHPERVPKLVVYYTAATNKTEGYKEVGFHVYPNPMDASFSITRQMDENTTVKIYNYTGVVVSEFASSNTSFDVHHLPAGFYTVEATKNGFTSSQKIIIQ
jgi:hypothetical protein